MKAANPPCGYLFLASLFLLDHLLAARRSCPVVCSTGLLVAAFCPPWLAEKGDEPPSCWRMEGCECPKLCGFVSQDLDLSGSKSSDIAEKEYFVQPVKSSSSSVLSGRCGLHPPPLKYPAKRLFEESPSLFRIWS